MTILLQNDRLPSPCESLWIPTSSTTLNGAKYMVNFEDVGGGDTVSTPFFQPDVKEESSDDDYDAGLKRPEKKRRLTAAQVQFLEKNFEAENKIEPERKMQLAIELGLQPRQVAIWFQNRRARFKNKQMEKDYDSLRISFEILKADYENLLNEKEKLKNELLYLKEKLHSREEGIESLKLFDVIRSPDAELEPIPNPASENVSNIVPMVTTKQEYASSAKSDVFDSDSPLSFLEHGDSSRVFEPDQSDFSHDEEDDLIRSFLAPPCFPKLYLEAPATSCNFEFSAEDQTFWSWIY
ncbi:unnamed protein product [Dovyalis caffra]|uniref:Homeobox-leucine zipper protein n=1 Tax=Dovyalis caffra TaxID=77055 RepID=A0AAV1REA7_9ROSI|nr:unnamed protein product [Dovyalis caffra]